MATAKQRLNYAAAAASIGTAVALIAIKGWAQLETGALSIAASLVDSALDLMIALANLAAMVYAARPADDDHRFGHTAAEDLAALAQAVLVSAAAGAIFWSATKRLIAPAPLEAEGAGLIAMGASVVLTGALVWWQRRVATRTGSKIVAADSAHYVSDFAPALASMAALAGSKIWGLTLLDPVLAMIAALWILRTGLGIGKEALDGLMDREAPAETVTRLAALAAEAPGVRGFHDLKTRMSGTRLFVQIHVEIDRNVTLHEAHAIGERLRRAMLAAHDDIDVTVHHDPV